MMHFNINPDSHVGYLLFGSAARDILAQGKSLGPTWGKDQKSAALAALIVLLG
jgi:hypothetical protein